MEEPQLTINLSEYLDLKERVKDLEKEVKSRVYYRSSRYGTATFVDEEAEKQVIKDIEEVEQRARRHFKKLFQRDLDKLRKQLDAYRTDNQRLRNYVKLVSKMSVRKFRIWRLKNL